MWDEWFVTRRVGDAKAERALKPILETSAAFLGVRGEISIDEVVSAIALVRAVGLLLWLDGFGLALAFAARVVSVFALSLGGALEHLRRTSAGFR